VQRALQGGGPGRGHRSLLSLGRQPPERIGQQMPAIRLVGDPVCGHQTECLLRGHLVPVDRLEDVVLILGRERHEGAAERRADGAAGKLVCGLR